MAWAKERNHYTPDQIKKANIRMTKYVMFYWLIDLFYMAIFNNILSLQFVFGGLAMLVVFYNVTIVFLSERKTNKWLLLSDFLIGLGLTVYLIDIIPDSGLQSIIIPLTSAVYGGLLTLVGVAWTIKAGNKKHSEEERKKLIPYLRLATHEEASCFVHTNFGTGLNFNKKEDLEKLSNNTFYFYKINDFYVKNISKDCIIIESIIVDDEEYYFTEPKLLENGKALLIKTTGNNFVNAANVLTTIQLKCKDLLYNEYCLNCIFEHKQSRNCCYSETEIAGVNYVGFQMEYQINELSLPKLIEK